MKSLFAKSFIRALIITLVAGVVIIGGIYAYETLWSAKVVITIEAPPEGAAGEWELLGVSVNRGTWDDATDTWTVSLARGEWIGARLTVTFKNTGDDVLTFKPYVDGQELSAWVAPGVNIQTTGDLSQLPAGASGEIRFSIGTTANAEPGTLRPIQLEIRGS